ncbi:MAG: L-2-amino-thiazoline-4-carboxylic acid hydrolase [Christensenellales bacterium]
MFLLKEGVIISKITNKPTKTDETTLALRGLCAKRASTICYMIQQAKEHSVQDGAAFAREAITKYGEDIGQVVKSKMKDPDDLLEFSQYFGAGADRDIYEMEVVAQDEDRFYLDFHYCPYVAEWQKMGRDPEEMAELCDIAMEGDRAVGASFDAFEFTLGETIAQGCPACQIRFDRVKK